MAAFFWLIVISVFGFGMVLSVLEDLSALTVEGKIFCGVVVAIGVIYIVIRERQDFKS